MHHVPERVPKRVQNEVGELQNTVLSLAPLLSLSSFIHSPSHENRTALENESPAEKRHGIGERVGVTPAFSTKGKYFSSLICSPRFPLVLSVFFILLAHSKASKHQLNPIVDLNKLLGDHDAMGLDRLGDHHAARPYWFRLERRKHEVPAQGTGH